MDSHQGDLRNGGHNMEEKDEVESALLYPDKDLERNADIAEKIESRRKADATSNIQIESDNPKALVYRVSENPPFHLALVSAIQQGVLSIASPLSITMIVGEVACCQDDNELKIQIFSATLFMVGLASFMMSTFGVRLPIFQGPSSTYLIPLLAMKSLDEWQCPATYNEVDPATNKTILMAYVGNNTVVPNREVSLAFISKMSGSLIAAGIFHMLLGMTGMIGIFIRYIGPITVVPTMTLVILRIYPVVIKFARCDWIVSSIVAITNVIIALYLSKRLTPIPMWSRQKGFHIYWYPFHTVFAMLISMCIGWMVAGIFTSANMYSDDPESRDFLARTDARSATIDETHWFIFPYPGQFGPYSFNASAFINFLLATMLSVLDSIGDYSACARVARVSPPPGFAFNRGLTIEGLMSTLGGSMGTCHATASYGGNIGAIGITKVASRRVFQLVGLLYLIFSIIGKFGAAFISMPFSVIGGLMFVYIGILFGIVLSFLQTIDLNNNRNTAIIGLALIVGLAVPYTVSANPEEISTGHPKLDEIIRMMLTNPVFVGGSFACFLDNTVPGEMKERGLFAQMKDLDDEEARELAKNYEDGPEVYRLSFIPNSFRRSRIARLIPLFDLTEDPKKQ